MFLLRIVELSTLLHSRLRKLTSLLLLKVSIIVVLLICFYHAPAFSQGITYPIKVSADGRRLLDGNDNPVFLNGDTPWSLIVELTKDETETYLEDRRLKGFNAIIVELIENYFGGPANRDGELPFNANDDFSQPNEAYFAHADWVINKAREKGILVVLTPAYLGYNCGAQGWCQEILANGEEKCRNFGRYLGQRYKDFENIIWLNGGDTAPGSAVEEVNAMIEGIKEFDTNHLHTAHCSRQNSALDCYDQPWLDINTTYSNCGLTASKIANDFLNREPTMPFFYVEGQYEGEGASERCIHAQAYWAILGGAMGHFFGNNPIWLLGSGWQQALDSNGSQSMAHMNRLFQSRRWYDLIPDFEHQVLKSDYGDINGDSYVGLARMSDSSTVIAYLPVSKTIPIQMDEVSGGSAKAWWFDPSSGMASFIANYPTTGSADFTPPGAGDWVLVIDDAAQDLGAPGLVDNSLPVELTTFSGNFDGDKMVLSWITLSESNNYGFEIQRSSDGNHFETIGFRQGQGTSNKEHVYSFEDSKVTPGLDFWYRLKQVDLDGDFSFSMVIKIAAVAVENFWLGQNYPNPFNPYTVITYSLAQTTKVELVLFDVRGRQVTQLVNQIQDAGVYSVNVSADTLVSGLYLYRLTAGNFVETRRMVLLK